TIVRAGHEPFAVAGKYNGTDPSVMFRHCTHLFASQPIPQESGPVITAGGHPFAVIGYSHRVDVASWAGTVQHPNCVAIGQVPQAGAFVKTASGNQPPVVPAQGDARHVMRMTTERSHRTSLGQVP